MAYLASCKSMKKRFGDRFHVNLIHELWLRKRIEEFIRKLTRPGEQTADAAAHDHDLGSLLRHRQTVIHAPLASTDLNTASSADAVCKMPSGEIGNAPCPNAALAK